MTLASISLILLPFSQGVKAVDKGGILHCLEKESPDSYDPITSHNMAGLRLTELMFESLLSETQWGGYEGRLAESWSFSQDSMSVTFRLRQDVKWCEISQDGVVQPVQPVQPFTAGDVLYTYELINNKRTTTDPYNRELLKDITKVNVLDTYTIEFTFKDKPMMPEEIFTFKVVPKYKIQGGFITTADPFVRSPVGTGYYVFLRDSGEDKILKANTAYYGEQANIDEVRMEYYSDQNTLFNTAFYSRQICAVIDARIKDIAKYGSAGYEIRRYAPLSFEYIGYNLKNEFFSDKKVRRALTCAIDRNRILRDQFLDMGKVISGPYPPASPLNNPDVDAIPFDTLLAKRLLQEAGFQDVGGEWIKDGKKLSFTLTVAAEQNEPAWSTAEHLRDYWKNIGVPVKLEKVTFPTWWQRVYQGQDFEATYGRWRCDRASDISPLFEIGSQKNYVSYSNPEVDSLIHLLDNITIPEERRVINWRLHEILAEDCPYTFLWSLYRYAAISKKVNRSHEIHDFNFFTYINRWWIPESEQWRK
jgi:peptide/nickel transport system substrate-binding protein